jgi:hypothetical protein
VATGTTEFIDNTTADVWVPEIWSALALAARENKLVFAQLVDRRFEDELTKGDVVHVGSVTNLGTARTKVANTAITYETQTETNTDVTVSTHNYQAMAVESITKVQANRDQLKLYAGKMGYSLALAVDDVLAGLIDDVTNTVGVLAQENTDDELIRSRQYLQDADAPTDGRVMVISPAAEAGILKLDRFVNNDYSSLHGGVQSNDLGKAYVTSWMRIPIYMSVNVEGTNAAGHDNAMFQKQAFALIMQMKVTPHHQYDIDYFADKVAMEQLYGTQTMRDDHAVWIKGA